jgi:antitoxin (DNA-binding transcriptional repressor) of toxin-antitoxin stability system
MKQKKINITDLQSDWSRYFELIDKGDEFIVTGHDKPLAIISPFSSIASSRESYERKTDTTYEEQMAEQNPDNRWWFG